MTDSVTTAAADSTKSPKVAHPPHAPPNADTMDEDFVFRHYLLRNVRYNTRRASLFEQWHKTTAVIGIFFGSTAAAAFFSAAPGWLPALLAAIIALTSALDLVVGTASKAALHLEIRRRWLALQQRMETEGLSTALYAVRRTIEMDEPVELSVVELMAHNDATLAMLGEDGRHELYLIPPWMRLVGQFVNLSTTNIGKQPHKRTETGEAPESLA